MKCALLFVPDANNEDCLFSHTPIPDCGSAREAYDRSILESTGLPLNTRPEISTVQYQLDENAAEYLNTSHLVFHGLLVPDKRFGSVAVGRRTMYAPIVVTTGKFGGFKHCASAAKWALHVFSTSIPENEVGPPVTLDELLKAHGNG